MEYHAYVDKMTKMLSESESELMKISTDDIDKDKIEAAIKVMHL